MFVIKTFSFLLFLQLTFISSAFSGTVSHLPRENWMAYIKPEEAGFSREKLQEAKAFYKTLDSTALFVVYDGVVIASWGEIHRKYLTHSIRKSLLSALYGIEVDRGRINLYKTIYDLGIDDYPRLTMKEKRANIEDMLTCRSGVYHDAAAESPEMVADRPPRGHHNPGEYWWYNNWSFNALGTVYEKLTNAKIGERFYEKIAAPIRMQDFEKKDAFYYYRPDRSIHPAYPFRMSARDLARFGLLYLNKGKWGYKKIIPGEWVEKSTSTVAVTGGVYNGYGYMWWVRTGKRYVPYDMYAALGMYGHSLFVVPEHKLVLVHRVDSDKVVEKSIKQVSQMDQLKLLDMIIKAKIGEPKSSPRLVRAGRINEP
jgi:CubicO group peptidase (beta-lactamase class C family)